MRIGAGLERPVLARVNVVSPMTEPDPAGMRAAPCSKTANELVAKPNKRLVAGNRRSDRRRAIGVVDYAGHVRPLRSNVTVSKCSINRKSADHEIAVDSFELH